MGKKRFPKYLKSPIQVLWFESDEIGIFFGFMGLFLTYKSWPTFAVMIGMPWLYRWAKKRYPRGFFEHAKYQIGIVELTHYPLSFEREFYE